MRSLEEKKIQEERTKGEKREKRQKSWKDVFIPCEQKVVTGVVVGCTWVNPSVVAAHR